MSGKKAKKYQLFIVVFIKNPFIFAPAFQGNEWSFFGGESRIKEKFIDILTNSVRSVY